MKKCKNFAGKVTATAVEAVLVVWQWHRIYHNNIDEQQIFIQEQLAPDTDTDTCSHSNMDSFLHFFASSVVWTANANTLTSVPIEICIDSSHFCIHLAISCAILPPSHISNGAVISVARWHQKCRIFRNRCTIFLEIRFTPIDFCRQPVNKLSLPSHFN